MLQLIFFQHQNLAIAKPAQSVLVTKEFQPYQISTPPFSTGNIIDLKTRRTDKEDEHKKGQAIAGLP